MPKSNRISSKTAVITSFKKGQLFQNPIKNIKPLSNDYFFNKNKLKTKE